jgi:hypothetical protein
MGVTSKDIAAQRAMLARGEEKRLRDQFAASVLPICNRNNRTDEQIAEDAYRLADAMLHERAKRRAIAANEKATRDAEDFAAIREQFLAWQKEQSVGVAEMDSAADRKSVATPRACASSCSQPFDSAPTTPAAWALFYPNGSTSAVASGKVADHWEPLYRKPQECPHVRGNTTQYCSLNFTLTDEEREAIEWYAGYGNGDHATTLRSLLERLE